MFNDKYTMGPQDNKELKACMIFNTEEGSKVKRKPRSSGSCFLNVVLQAVKPRVCKHLENLSEY